MLKKTGKSLRCNANSEKTKKFVLELILSGPFIAYPVDLLRFESRNFSPYLGIVCGCCEGDGG